MAWFDWIDEILEGAGLVMGGLNANEESKNAMSPKDVWNVGNPSINSPWYNTTSDWNRGNPTQDIQTIVNT